MTSPISTERLKEILDVCEGLPVQSAAWAPTLGEMWVALDVHVTALPAVQQRFHEERVRRIREYLARLDPATIAAMASELLAAREALRPFSEAAQEIPDAWPDDLDVTNVGGKRPITVGDFRRARALSGNRSGE